MYQMFRNQFLSFSMYQSKLLRALGEGLGPAVAAHSSQLSRVVLGLCPALGWSVCAEPLPTPSRSPRRLCAVPPVLLPERVLVPAAGAGREAQHGPDRG